MRHRRLSTVLILLGALASSGALAAPAAASLFPAGVAIDGPSPDVVGLGDIAISRDGSGGMAYVKRVGGVPHAFASALRNGAWSAPRQLDSGLPGAASRVAMAAGEKGRLAAVFIDDGTLYATVRKDRSSDWSAPQSLMAGATFPSLGMSISGTAYVSFTAAAGSVTNVFVARLDRSSTTFAVFPQTIDLTPGMNAGDTEQARSRVAVASDGQALVTWAEQGPDGQRHVGARRVSQAGPSSAPQDLTLASLDGQPGSDADSAVPTVRDVADYGWVVFRQTFVVGTAPVSRTIARHELGSIFEAPVKADPLSFPTADGAATPQVRVDGLGNGLTAVGLTGSHQVWSAPIRDPDLAEPGRIDGATANVLAPSPVIGLGNDNSGLVAWQQSAGPTDPPSLHARPWTGSGFGEEGVISAAAFGPVDLAAGVSAAADRHGNVLIAFVQGTDAARRLVVGGLADPPADFSLRTTSRFTNHSRPLIAWTASSSVFGLSGYRVEIDGRLAGTVSGLRFVPTAPIADGVHRLTVGAIDHYGQRTRASLLLRVDTHPPSARLQISGGRSAGSSLNFVVHASDGSRRTSSGIGAITVSFGDGSSGSGANVHHTYGRSRTYTVRVVVSDRAGNRRVLRQQLAIR